MAPALSPRFNLSTRSSFILFLDQRVSCESFSGGPATAEGLAPGVAEIRLDSLGAPVSTWFRTSFPILTSLSTNAANPITAPINNPRGDVSNRVSTQYPMPTAITIARTDSMAPW